jgi:hypothetical protein
MHTLLRCFVSIACAACGPRTAPEQPKIVPPPSSTVVSSPVELTVEAVAVPRALVVDGKLDEWRESMKSGVAVALAPTALYVAAELGDAKRGIWLGIQATPAKVPPVGEYKIVAGSEVDPEMGIVVPECAASNKDPLCVAALKKIEEGEKAYTRRFVGWYLIDEAGVRTDALAPVPSAKVAQARSGNALEIELPLGALPRFAEAPITSLALAVRLGSETPPSLVEKEWTQQTLPAPIAFEPFGKLRALAFEDSSWMSYQPGAPLQVEATRYPTTKDRSRFLIQKEPLYAKQITLGDVEIGYLAAGFPAEVVDRFGLSDRLQLVVIPKGAEPSALRVKGTPLLLAERAGEVHAVFVSTTTELVHDGSPDSVFVPATSASFSGYAIERSGKHRELTFDDVAAPYWEDVEPYQDGETLGLRGHTMEWRRGVGKRGDLIDLSWRWDPKRALYVGKRSKRR